MVFLLFAWSGFAHYRKHKRMKELSKTHSESGFTMLKQYNVEQISLVLGSLLQRHYHQYHRSVCFLSFLGRMLSILKNSVVASGQAALSLLILTLLTKRE